jgi:hypothetical protein
MKNAENGTESLKMKQGQDAPFVLATLYSFGDRLNPRLKLAFQQN